MSLFYEPVQITSVPIQYDVHLLMLVQHYFSLLTWRPVTNPGQPVALLELLFEVLCTFLISMSRDLVKHQEAPFPGKELPRTHKYFYLLPASQGRFLPPATLKEAFQTTLWFNNLASLAPCSVEQQYSLVPAHSNKTPCLGTECGIAAKSCSSGPASLQGARPQQLRSRRLHDADPCGLGGCVCCHSLHQTGPRLPRCHHLLQTKRERSRAQRLLLSNCATCRIAAKAERVVQTCRTRTSCLALDMHRPRTQKPMIRASPPLKLKSLPRSTPGDHLNRQQFGVKQSKHVENTLTELVSSLALVYGSVGLV